MNIILISKTLDSEVLVAGRSLLAAYFPEALVQVVGAENLVAEDNPEAKSSGSAGEAEGRIFIERHTLNSLALDMEWSADPALGGGYGSTGQALPEKAVASISGEDCAEILAQPKAGREEPLKTLLKHAIIRLLARVTGEELPWGILTGIRPSKIVHYFEEQGIAVDAQKRALQKRYAVHEDKIELLREIASIQETYLADWRRHPEKVAVYTGIPFCPTRCTYCSFPAYALATNREELPGYLDALYEEARRVGELMRSQGLFADSIYLGGGTPTILNESELYRLLEHLKACIPHREWEFTVEAGRPDTLNPDKLAVLWEAGARRVSINSQTLIDATLHKIGRGHDVAAFFRAYEEARRFDWVINTDLILGLPGEGVDEVRATMKGLARLEPDNVTVHALAIKRGSKERETGGRNVERRVAEQMQEVAQASILSWGLRPYYLYRQKQIAGNLENTGYAKSDTECRYNIGIIEERQSIIGLGAGASSKVVNAADYSLENMQHQSNWQAYIKQWPVLHEKRIREFARIGNRIKVHPVEEQYPQ